MGEIHYRFRSFLFIGGEKKDNNKSDRRWTENRIT